MSVHPDGFRRVLAEAGEPEPAVLPAGERALAGLQAAAAELSAGRMARWQRLEASRRAGWEAYQLGCARMGIEPRPLDHFPWMAPPRPCRIW